MRHFITGFVVVLCFLAGNAQAGELRDIELKDGSIVTGEVLSLNNGIYTIRSESLGTIKLEESKVRAIRALSSSGNAAPGQTAGHLTHIQNKMMNDKEVMELIQSLQNDPDFKKVLEDPELMKAITAGDVAALTANPQFMKLLNNSTVREIEKKVQ